MAVRCCSVVIISLIIVVPVSRVHGQVGVTMSLNGEMIANDSFVNVSSIGENNDALLCHTNNNDCCGTASNRGGEWYFSGTPVGKKGNPAFANNFYRNRGPKVVRLNRHENPPERGQFYCEVPDADGVNQTVFVNIVDIGSIIITQHDITTAIAGEQFTLECSVNITPNYSSRQVTFNWFFGLTKSSLPSDVTVSEVTNSSNTYTSTAYFSPLSLSHTGIYTCQLWQNENWEHTTMISVKCIAVGFKNNSYQVLEGNKIKICLDVAGDITKGAVVTIITVEGTAKEADDFTAVNMNLVISMTTDVCINISTTFDENPVNIEEHFSIQLSSSNPDVIISPDKDVSSVVIKNIPPPEIEPLRENITSDSGNTVTFIVSSNFTSTAFQWQINGEIITGEQQRILTISDVTDLDEGNYTCIVSTTFGVNITSNMAQLFVYSPAVISDNPSNKTVPEGMSATFSVEASGDGLSYQWQRDNMSLQQDNDNKFEGVHTMTLTVNNVQVEHAGAYRCVVTNGAGDKVTSNEANLTVVIPPSSPMISETKFESNNINISWNKDVTVDHYNIQYNVTILECAGEISAMQNGNYKSSVMTVNSSFYVINGSVNRIEENTNYTISITAVNTEPITVRSEPTITTITTEEAAPSGGPVSVSNLTIYATSIIIKWEKVPCHERNGEITSYSIIYYQNSDVAQKSVNVSGIDETNRTFVARGLLPRTSYTFEVRAINSRGIGPATKETFNTTVPDEVGFFLNGNLYSNNSIVNFEEIGIENRSLICLTNSQNCCGGTSNGDWYDPDNMTVTENRDDNTTDYYYYTSNGPSMVRLNKIDNAANGQGVFRCIIPDASGNNQRIFVGIYSSEMGIPNSANLTFNVPTLTCTSTGGPATTVTWKKNGQDLDMDGAVYEQNKVITDTQTAEYQSTLILPKRNITDFNSQYECIVENVRGSSNASLTLQALKIIENDTFILGEPAALTCTSIISVDELVWLDHEGIVLVNVSSKNTSAMSADLTFNQVNDSIHNKTFTCGAERKGTVEKDIFVSVSAPLYPVINVTINTSQDDPVVIVGDQFKLTCVVHVIEGFTQEPAVVWRHPNGSEINDSSIEFNPVRASDGGNYTCNGMLVSPLFDMPRITGDILFTLTIKLPPPNVSIHHPVGTLYAGSSVNITYEVSLINEVDIDVLVEVTCHSGRGTVVKNGSNLTPKSDSDYTNNFTSFLTLSPLSARDINISCTANISQVNNALYIMESPSGSAIIQLLNINNPSVNVTITPSSEGHQSVGSQFNIACATRGFDHLNPRFDIQWGKISGLIDDSPQVNASLSFSSLKLSDAGEYTCEVNVTSDYLVNGYTTGMGNYNLSITIPTPSVDVKVMNPMDIFFGSNFTLICTITLDMELAMAQVSVKWSVPTELESSMVVPSNEDSGILEHSTQLSFNSVSLNHSGDYSCEATVMATNSPYLLPSVPSSVSVQIIIIPAPSAPNITILRPLNSTAVEIEWAKGNTVDDVYKVTIQYMYEGPCSCLEYNSLCKFINFSDTSNSTYHYNIPSLQEGSVYTFRVIASNPSGSSTPTEMNVTTLPAAPSDSPQSLNITTFNLTSISIQWREVECFERNSDIIGYTITFDQTTENVSSTMREFTAPRLFPNTTYTFLIAAISSNGTGPFRNISGSTSSPNEVSLLLNGRLLPNNSVITWMEIGSGNGSLFCLTDIVDCCDSASDSGNWYFPNGSIVTSDHSTSMGVYQKYEHSSILLQHSGDTSAVSGIFRCEVIDSSGIDQNLYIGIYSESRNQARLNTVSFSLKNDVNIKFDLNCSSEGGPISQMLWLVDGTVINDSTPFPILADAEEGLYYSTLHRHGRLVGNYSCVIELTDENNVKSNMTQSYYVQALQPPSDVNAVWIYDVEIFHICWMTSDSGRLQASLYRVLSGDKTVLYQNASLSNEKIAANVINKYNNRNFSIQALLETALPSELLPVNVSAAGVSLLHNGRNVENGSVLSIDSIGESYDMSLICKTNRTNCCRSYSHRFGEWYSQNGIKIPNNESDYKFYRTRSDDGEVFLHQRSSNHASSSMVGVYCCEVPDTDENCDVTQRLCVNLASLVVDMIGQNVAGENYSLSCTSAVGSERMDDPTFEWSGPNGTIHLTSNSLADSGIMLENTNTLDTFTSTLKFGPLQASHRGNYTCTVTFQGNSESSSFIVNVLAPKIYIRFSKNNQLSIGQSYNLTCSLAGAEKLNANIAYQWTKDNGTGTFVIADANYIEFPVFRLSNTGNYTCEVNVSSIYLDGIIRESKIINLSVEMPDPDSVIVQSIGTQDRPLFLPNEVVTNTTLNCTVTLNENVDIPVTVKTMWMRLDELSSTEVAAIDVGITHLSQVVVSDLSISKAGAYECTAIVMSSPASIFVTGEGRKSSNTTLALFNITIEDELLSYQVGDVVNVSCTVTTGGTDERPMIYWNGLNGVQNGSTSNNLNFNPLMASQAGTYFCHASFGSSEGKESISISAELDVDLSVHPNTSSPVKAGDNISMMCVAKINKTLIDVNVSVELHLTGPQGVYAPRTIENSNLGLFMTSISFPSITAEDAGDFYCNITVNAASTRQLLKPISNDTNYDLILIPSKPTVNMKDLTVRHNSTTITWSQTSRDRVNYYLIEYSYQDTCNNSFQSSRINHTQVGDKEAILVNLEEYSNYLVTVTAVNIQGNSSTKMTIRTLSAAPTEKPCNVAKVDVTSTSIHLEWEDVNCLDRNGIITNYTLHYQPNIMNYTTTSLSVTTVNNFLTVTNLIPRTSYTFQVAANNINGTGPSESINAMTNPVEKVMLFHNGDFRANNSIITIDEIGTGEMALLCFTDELECCNNKPNRSGEWYIPNGSAVRVNSKGDNIYRDRGPSVVRLNQRNSSSYSANGLYCCQIPDINMNESIYIGLYPNGKGKPTVESVAFDANQQSLICISANGPASNVTWNRHGKNLTIDGIKYSQVQQVENTSESIYINTLLIRDLEPDEVAGNYTCIVSNVRGNAQQSLEIRDIRVTGHESALPHGSSFSLNCTTDLAVDKIEWLNTEGSIIKTGNDSILELIVTDTDTKGVKYTCRITSAFGNQTKNITLKVLSEPASSSVISSAVSAIVVAIVMAVLVTVLIIIVFVIVRRKRQGRFVFFSSKVKSKPHPGLVVLSGPLHGNEDDVIDDDKIEMSTFGKGKLDTYRGGVVSITDFGKHVKKMHDDRDEPFETEYASISKDPQNSYAIADIVVNRFKNRFANIFPYDYNRVKLKDLAGAENSNYINASYMDGYEKPKGYIAAQGPLPNTLEDYWRMVWENRLTTIVMLTQCFEGRKKCECYWPENINCTFEAGQGIEIILTSMTPFAEYTVRKMTVTKSTEPNVPPLEVVQFHFLAWPDHGVPNNCAVMLNFVRRVRKLHPYSNPCPLLVHCSAGVGRTGTFIVLDSMLERMKTEDTLNVYDFVNKLRTQRVLMVQSLAQYIFIHDALKEVILCGQTEIPAADMRMVINQLNIQNDPCSASTGFEHQFQVLCQMPCVTEDDCYSNATSEHNKPKNRYHNRLPNNFYRVRMKSTATPGSDYINASFIDGYRQKNTYIATQGPLESTVCDFWRMVWEKESKCVVLLSKLMEEDKEMCFRYWPSTVGNIQRYGQITVKMLSEDNYGDYNLRKFEINEDKTGVVGVKTAFTVTLFHFLVWPEHETPPITSSLIELMDDVNKVQMRSGNRPMIVMCNDGVGRTGTFISIHAQLERMKTEGVVDFFQFVKSARMHRAGLISEVTQYVLCHDVVANYLDSFDTYANFKEVV